MDKEMKAKIDEVLKTNGKRELSLDEMDRVSGGSFPADYRINGYTAAEAGGMLQAVYDNFGLDVAEAFAIEVFGVKTNDWRGYMQASADLNAGRYAVDMIWNKGYNSKNGGFGAGY